MYVLTPQLMLDIAKRMPVTMESLLKIQSPLPELLQADGGRYADEILEVRRPVAKLFRSIAALSGADSCMFTICGFFADRSNHRGPVQEIRGRGDICGQPLGLVARDSGHRSCHRCGRRRCLGARKEAITERYQPPLRSEYLAKRTSPRRTFVRQLCLVCFSVWVVVFRSSADRIISQ